MLVFPAEPVHGSAPDIAGQDRANPLAELLSFCMMLRYSLESGEDADLIDSAVENVFAMGVHTADIAGEGHQAVSCSATGNVVFAELDQLAA